MLQIGSKYIKVGQDGDKIDTSTKSLFSLIQGIDTRFKFKDPGKEVYDFVGLICKKDEILVVFPKHYFSQQEIKVINSGEKNFETELKNLFNAIYKYINNKNTKADRYAGNLDEFESDFPFKSFFSIYNYFQQYGLYKEKILKTKKGYSGKINWKETIRKSKKIYSEGNIIHFPLLIKQKKNKEVFISECMAFAIDYTLERFSFLFSLPKTNFSNYSFNFLSNTDYVVGRLQALKNEVFKDAHKKLINSLIDFFSDLKEHKKGGDIHIKIKYFNLIWEEMIHSYLNKFFVEVNQQEDNLIFNKDQKESLVQFNKKSFNVDASNNKFTIEPDHYFENDKVQYIFDAKYYLSVNNLNYKQYAYHEMLNNNTQITYSALIVPNEKEEGSELHFLLDDKFIGDNGSKTKILLQKIKTKDVLNSYVE